MMWVIGSECLVISGESLECHCKCIMLKCYYYLRKRLLFNLILFCFWKNLHFLTA